MAIIKCPECGHEVSSAAEKCPNCGVAIAGNIMTCPDCGRVVLRSTTTCPSCGAKLTAPAAAQGGYKAPQPERREQYNNTDPYAAQQSEEPKKKKKGPLMAVIIVVAVIVIGVLAYVLIGNAQSAKSEQEAYESVIASSDTALYGQYLRDYPDGKHAEEVKAKLATLVAEIKDWNDACVNNTRSSFATFLTNHPGSPYEQACKDKIDSLDYQDALAAGTVDALQMYISSRSMSRSYRSLISVPLASSWARKIPPATMLEYGYPVRGSGDSVSRKNSPRPSWPFRSSGAG